MVDFEETRSVLEGCVGEQVLLSSVLVMSGIHLPTSRESVFGVFALGLNALDADWAELRQAASDGEVILVVRRVASGELLAAIVLDARRFVEAEWVESDGRYAFVIETERRQFTLSSGPEPEAGLVRVVA